MKLEDIYKEVPTFDLTPPPTEEPVAAPPRNLQFAAWAERCVAEAAGEGTAIAIYEAQVGLLHKFMEYRRLVGARERYRHGTPERPTLWSVFEAAYEELLTLELGLTHRFLPPPMPVPPAPVVEEEDEPPGLYIGAGSA